jgi:hypothetical protein
MLINQTTGEIAYHCFLLQEDGAIKFKQSNLKNNQGNIKYIPPKKS